jgi:hypothetical protein
VWIWKLLLTQHHCSTGRNLSTSMPQPVAQRVSRHSDTMRPPCGSTAAVALAEHSGEPLQYSPAATRWYVIITGSAGPSRPTCHLRMFKLLACLQVHILRNVSRSADSDSTSSISACSGEQHVLVAAGATTSLPVPLCHQAGSQASATAHCLTASLCRSRAQIRPQQMPAEHRLVTLS